ncbi:MAG: crosslink repair DNA glycosylase YcaQ family protein [Acidimicrobiia bacterium]|nr:crosslink repair DNA glycosylase YcaQ family protein [Acidimicrobiia bacterium]
MDALRREQILGYRLRVNHLAGERLPAGSLPVAARSGLQDGSPRSALLSLAARVEDVGPDDWRADALAQVFGPRGAVYVVPAADVGVFTRGLLPRHPARVAELEQVAGRVHAVLGGAPMRQADVMAALPGLAGTRELRWAATLGTLVATWDTVDTIVHPAPRPAIGAGEARLELARRFFEYLGPATVKDLQWWLAGSRADAAATVEALGNELAQVVVEGRECLALASSLPRQDDRPDPDLVHLLPPDDVYINRLNRHLLVPAPDRQRLLWPQAPPPGALIVGGETQGTWRRLGSAVTITPWGALSPQHRERAEAIAAGWPLGDDSKVTVSWADPA